MPNSIYFKPTLVDRYDNQGNVMDGDWRTDIYTANNFYSHI